MSGRRCVGEARAGRSPSADASQRRQSAGHPCAEQGRPRLEAEAASAPRPVQQGPSVRRTRAAVGRGWHERGYARRSDPALSAGRGAALSAGLLHRSERALLCIGDRPRAGAAADARRAPVFDGRGRRQVRRIRVRTDQAVLHDPRRARVAEADRRGEGRLDDQSDRHGSAPGTGGALRPEGVPRPAREGEVRVARRRPTAR